MAKQSVGPLVRHLDKAILALAGAGLLYVVAQFGVVSPNKIESSTGEMLGPTQVDDTTRQKADALRDRLKSKKVEATPYENPIPGLNELLNPIVAANVPRELPRAMMFPPMVPKIHGEIETGEGHTLAKVIKLGPPKVQSGRSGAEIGPASKLSDKSQQKTSLHDVNWVTVSASFDRAKQESMAKAAGYDPKRIVTLFTGTDLQRRVLKADGTYSDWTDANTVSPYKLPELPSPQVYKVEDGEGFNVSDSDRAKVDAFKQTIADGASQLALMRPLFPETMYGVAWRYPRGFDYDVTEMDAEYQGGKTACRYPECSADVDDSDQDLSFKKLIGRANEELDNGNFKKAKKLAELAEKKTDGQDRKKAKVDDLLKKIDIAEQAAGGRTVAHLPKQVLWAHDAAVGEVKSGRTYQYRMRARIYNQYCGTPPLLKDAKDAAEVEIVGPWSDPSEPVSIDRDTIFFVKSGRKKKQECTVELYKWVAGEWIGKSFKLTAGAPVGEEGQRVKTHRSKSDTVDFSTGASVVDINFSRSYWPRDKRNGRSKKATTTISLVYVDASGQLHEQFQAFDKGSDLYKYYKGIAWKAPRR
ncbi:MAG: hypothetical protein GXP29_15345 [Planctomycetes bacterium]|nr:hypothetical protein [Planctomycetota bacterium]